ncbi:histone-lysine N-methyltransferase EHMT1-like, partial [Notothenia coriiceps]|uniref:Histone-lysine N-methyltransferase EHMT1-like n=1 Tax=Notothenia coriiceps TaxID=8208 RepID=A0A6I9NRI1_9TELE
MEHRGAGEGPGRRPSSPSSGTPMGAKGQAALSVQKPRVKVTPFHGSPVASSDGALRSTRTAASAHGSLFLDTLGRLNAPPVRGRAAAGSSEEPPRSSGSAPAPTGVNLQSAGRKAVKSSTMLCPSHKGKERRAVSSKPPSAVKRRKRKMGMYNLVPKKKAKAIKQQEKKEEPGPSVQQNRAAAEEKPVMLTETLQPLRSELLMEGDPGEGEYTELALECLDLKAQEELLSPPLSDAKVTESDLLEELPLCCCRMETPYSGGSRSTIEQTCMAMESMDGMLSRCQRRVMKQEMMRPSNKVHLLVLCEEHRAGMVKHHCCPGCGLFCRAVREHAHSSINT